MLRELQLPPASKQPKAAATALEKRIKEQVRSLEYGDDVAQGVVTLVRDWNLVALAQQLDMARQRQKHGKLSTDQLASVEQKVAEQIARMINAVILYDNEKQSIHELPASLATRKVVAREWRCSTLFWAGRSGFASRDWRLSGSRTVRHRMGRATSPAS